MLDSSSLLRSRSALVVAHPGHELRVHGWLHQAKPIVFVLTDGSGGMAQSRLESTRRIVRDAGAIEGSIFGRFPDREVYAAMMRHDAGFFTALADELAAGLIAADCQVVLCDAREGYNSGHDVCWFLVEAAVAMATHALDRTVVGFDFPLMGDPARPRADGIRLTLDDDALEHKLRAASTYPEMAAEVEAAVARFTARAFQIEHFDRADHDIAGEWRPRDTPFYEQYGEQQVAAGVYADVLRAREHMMPLVASLRRHVCERTGCPHSLSC